MEDVWSISVLFASLLVALFCWYNCENWFEKLWTLVTVSMDFYDPGYLSKYDREEASPDYGLIKAWFAKYLDSEKGVPQGAFRLSSHVTGFVTRKAKAYGKPQCKVQGTLQTGSTFFTYAGTLYRVKLIKLRNSGSDEKVNISTFKWNASRLTTLLEKILEINAGQKKSKTTVFTIKLYEGWKKLGNSKVARRADTVFLVKGQVEQILHDVRTFLESKSWYQNRCIPHRRGYVLYGPPGCGKTSLVRAIAGELNLDICALSLSSPGLSDGGLLKNLNCTPTHNCLILIEDVDCAFKTRADKSEESAADKVAMAGGTGSSVTFSGLLNALDGVASCDGKLVFLTTNHPEKLDPALTRPGRVDMKILVDYPDAEQVGRFFHQFYPEASESMKLKLLEIVKRSEHKISMAMLQGLFLRYKDSPQESILESKSYFEEQFKILPKGTGANSSMYL